MPPVLLYDGAPNSAEVERFYRGEWTLNYKNLVLSTPGLVAYWPLDDKEAA